MLPRHLIRAFVAVPAVVGGLVLDNVVAPPWALVGLALFVVGVYELLGAVCSWVGWLAHRAALRRRGVDPDRPDSGRPVPVLNGTLIWDRPYTPGRAAVPVVSRVALCGCRLDPVSGRVRHARRCRYAGAHRPGADRLTEVMFPAHPDVEVLDAVVVEAVGSR